MLCGTRILLSAPLSFNGWIVMDGYFQVGSASCSPSLSHRLLLEVWHSKTRNKLFGPLMCESRSSSNYVSARVERIHSAMVRCLVGFCPPIGSTMSALPLFPKTTEFGQIAICLRHRDIIVLENTRRGMLVSIWKVGFEMKTCWTDRRQKKNTDIQANEIFPISVDWQAAAWLISSINPNTSPLIPFP